MLSLESEHKKRELIKFLISERDNLAFTIRKRWALLEKMRNSSEPNGFWIKEEPKRIEELETRLIRYDYFIHELDE